MRGAWPRLTNSGRLCRPALLHSMRLSTPVAAPHSCPPLRRNGRLTGAQIRSGSAVCNRGLCFQTEAWRRLGMHVAVLTQARSDELLCFLTTQKNSRVD